MNLFRWYRYDAEDYVVVNLKYCLDNYQMLIDLVRYYLREIILISDHFESINLNSFQNEKEKEVLLFIKENLDKIQICDTHTFNKKGLSHYIKNGLESSGNLSNILNTIDDISLKKTNFLFLSNRFKSFRINLLNYLIKNKYEEKICIKFNHSGDFTGSHAHIFKDVSDTEPLIRIPYKNDLFNKIYGDTEPLFGNRHLNKYEPSDLYKAIQMCFKSRFFISSESSIGSYCLSEKCMIPFLASSIPIILMSGQTYDRLKEFGFYLEGFFIKYLPNDFEHQLKFILEMSDIELKSYYYTHSIGIKHNLQLMKDILTSTKIW